MNLSLINKTTGIYRIPYWEVPSDLPVVVVTFFQP